MVIPAAYRHHMSLDDDNAPPAGTSCWTRCMNRIWRKTAPPGADKIDLLVHDPEEPLLKADAKSDCEPRCEKAVRAITLPLAGLFSIASTIGVIANATIFPNTYLGTVSSFLLGLCGQTVASHAKKAASSPCSKGIALYAGRIQEHTSLFTMMVTGYFKSEMCVDTVNCAPVLVNCGLAGMLASLKIQRNDALEELADRLSDQEEKPDSAPPSPPQSSTEKVISFIKNNRRQLIAGTAAALSLYVTGATCMYLFNQIVTPRVCSGFILLTEYGLKGLGGVLGYTVEQLLHADRQNPTCKKISKILSRIDGLSIGFALYGHQVLPTNIEAALVTLPIGFFLGTSISKMRRVSELEDRVFAKNAVLKRPSLTHTSIAIHVTTTALFWSVSGYLWYAEIPKSVGYDLFLTLVPPIYFFTRFVATKERSAFLHFLLQKNPQLLAEELNYGVSFLKAGLIEETISNAHYYFAAQATLFATVEAALFTLDQIEDLILENEEQPGSPEAQARLQMITALKNMTTRNHARMDMIFYILLNTFLAK